MKNLLLATALIAASTGGAMAADPYGQLSKPLITYTPIIGMNMELLALTPDQKAAFKAWKSTMPAQRKALQAETVALRDQMRTAIATGAPEAERQAIADKIGAMEVELIMMRSNCADHWRAVLTEEQFAKVVQLSKK